MLHNTALTRAAAALLASGATFHVKDAGDPLETLKKAFGDHNTEVLKKLGASDQFIKDLSTRLIEVEQKMVSRGHGGPMRAESWGSQFVRDSEVKALSDNWRGRLRVDVKATITSLTTDAAGSAGDLVVPDYQQGVIPIVRRKPRLRQLFAPGQTSGNAIFWPKMTGRTKGAAGQVEAAAKGQSDIKFDLLTWPVKTIAHWMLASKQILSDAPALTSIIDTELRDDLADVEEAQLLTGSGVGEDLTGVYTTATAYSAPFVPMAAGNLTKIDILLLAIAQVEAAGYDADGVVINALDWRDIQMTKTEDGSYMAGSPFTAEQIARLWQLPIITTNAMTVDKFMVGAHRQGAQIFDREMATVEVSTEDSDNFRKNLVTLRGEERLAFVIKHPDAFVKGDFSDALAA